MCRPLFRILFGFILQQNAILLEVGNLFPCMLKKYELRLRLFAHFANMPKAQIQTKYATCLLHYKLLPTASILYVCKTMNARALHTVLVTPTQIPWHLCRVEVGTAEAKVLRGSSKPNFSQKIHWHAILEPPCQLQACRRQSRACACPAKRRWCVQCCCWSRCWWWLWRGMLLASSACFCLAARRLRVLLEGAFRIAVFALVVC